MKGWRKWGKFGGVYWEGKLFCVWFEGVEGFMVGTGRGDSLGVFGVGLLLRR